MSATLPLPDFTHERVEMITGRRSGLFIAVALHSSVLGSALGGARLWTLPALERRARRRAAAVGGHDAEERRGGPRRGRRQVRHRASPGHRARRGASARGVPRPRRRRRVAARALPHRGGRRLDDRGHAHRQRAHRATSSVFPRRSAARASPPARRASACTSRCARHSSASTGSADVAGRRITISGIGQVGSRLAVRLSSRRCPTHGHRRQPRQARPRARARRRVDAPRARSTSSRPTCSSPPASAVS